MAIRLPGGRGTLEGANANSLVGEELRSRQKEFEKQRTWRLTRVVTEAYTAAFDDFIIADPSSASFTVTLPSAKEAKGQRIGLKINVSTSNTVTLAASGDQTIDGNATMVIRGAYAAVELMSDGEDWMLTYLGANETLNLYGSLYVEDSVGIGTTSPDGELDITTADSTTDVYIDNTATDGDPQLHFQLGGISTFCMGIDDGDSDKFKIGTTAVGTNTRMAIDSSGNIGMGTATPTEKVHMDTGDGGGLLVEDDTAATIYMYDSGGTVNARKFKTLVANDRWVLRSIQDDGTSVKSAIRVEHATGYVGLNKTASSPLDIDLPTHDLEIVDAHDTTTCSGTAAGYIQVEVNGTTRYIRLFPSSP